MSRFHYSADHDVNDDQPWSAEDVRDLENHIRQGASLEETAEFLCRSGTVEVVVEKAEQLGLTSQDPPNAPTKLNRKTERACRPLSPTECWASCGREMGAKYP